MRFVSKLLFFSIFKWKLIGSFPQHLNKYVIIAAPHTSWVDFLLALSVRNITGVKPYFFGKSSLFNKPFGYFFRSLKGIPVNRSSNQNYVEIFVEKFNNNEHFILALSPEGTRQKVQHWKTGFYHIADKAQVPIVKVALDFQKKEIRIDTPFQTTGNYDKDLEEIKTYYIDVVGRHPHFS